MNINLQSAFNIINSLIIEKDNRIKELEEENKKLNLKLSELKGYYGNKEDKVKENYDKIDEKLNYNYEKERNKINGYKVDEGFNLTPVSSSIKNINSNINSSINGCNTCPEVNNNSKNAFINTNFQQYKTSTKMIISNENNINLLKTGNSSPSAMDITTPIKNTVISEPNLPDTNTSRNEIKTFLQEVRQKIPAREFKEFIQWIKILTDKNKLIVNRKEIFQNVKNLFGSKSSDLYQKFESLLSVKNNK